MMMIATASVVPKLPMGSPSIFTSNFVTLSILDDDDNGIEPRSIGAGAGMASQFQGSARRQCNTRP